MNRTELDAADAEQASALHDATCRLMTLFIEGCHRPQLARLIITHLQTLETHPGTRRRTAALAKYRQLLRHWQDVADALNADIPA